MLFIRLCMTARGMMSKTARPSGLKWDKQYISPVLKIQGRTLAMTGLNRFSALS